MAEKAGKQQTYSKQAFVDAAKNSKERLILQVVLNDKKKYTQIDVKNLVNEWKKKEVK
ncbi:hypothetical protein [Mesobacillus stamsii]|uniref:Uncharacterized protein n=1 Tax=Mesobacillus stamsii TaxID=225347 RepID=A0ABU0FS31_9BACI|nr:hypothetical protein [Mesobacillus stamsii]MDQ0412724.1 hypothetical protein [Mesobacillus stamsii]